MPEVALAPAGPGERAALEALVRAWYAEGGLRFDAGRQGAALAALTAGDPFGLAWLVRHAGATVGYVVMAQGFSRDARGRGLQRLYLEVAHGNRALDLYRRAGFLDHRRYLMSKDL